MASVPGLDTLGSSNVLTLKPMDSGDTAGGDAAAQLSVNGKLGHAGVPITIYQITLWHPIPKR